MGIREVKVPFIGQPDVRGHKEHTDILTYGQFFQNCWFQRMDGKFYALDRRPGFVTNNNLAADFQGPMGRLHYWENSTSPGYVWSGLQPAGPNTRVNITGIGPTIYDHASNSPVTFYLDGYSGTTPALVWQRGNREAWYYPEFGAVTQIAAIPANNVGPISYIDGFYVVGVGPGAKVRHSALNDPTTWPANNEATAGESSDTLVACVRYKNYILAFGASSLEFFYNAGNPTGSVFRRAQQLYQRVGLTHEFALAEGLDSVFFISSVNSRGPMRVYQLSNTALIPISPPWLDAILSEYTSSTVYLNFVSLFGVPCLVLAITFSFSGTTYRMAYVYDFELKFWHTWRTLAPLDMGLVMKNAPDGRVFTACTSVIPGYAELDVRGGAATYQDGNGGGVAASAIPRVIRTPSLDFGTPRGKVAHMLEVLADQSATAAADYNVTVEYSDDEFATFTTWGTVDLKRPSGVPPRLVAGGRFTKRAFRVSDSVTDRSRMFGLSLLLEDLKA